MVNGVFVEPGGFRLIDRSYQRLHEVNGTFDDMLYDAKKLILRTAMSSELYVLARRLDRISEQHRWSRDFTASTLHLALGEVIACFPVYRTYAESDTHEISPNDRMHILRALREAKRRNRSTSESIFDFIGDLLLLRDPEGITDADRAERRELVLRIQQLTGPVMAKGLEDTVFYRYFPLASLNEVGGRPTTGVVPLDHFHNFCARRQQRWPAALSASATHDTKRGEDTRARLDVLSEIPREWLAALRRWERLNRKAKPRVEDAPVPGSNEEYFIYQTLVGVWPLEGVAAELDEAAHKTLVERVSGYLTKALREAKLHTSWVNVDEPYEKACQEFLARVLDRRGGDNPFLADLRQFLGRITLPGLYNSLSQVLLKITVPGVPDFYQGTELWDFSLVDPDNRRPVDYAARRALRGRLTEPRRAERDRRGGHRRAGRRRAEAAGHDARAGRAPPAPRAVRRRRVRAARGGRPEGAPRRGFRAHQGGRRRDHGGGAILRWARRRSTPSRRRRRLARHARHRSGPDSHCRTSGRHRRYEHQNR